MSFDERAVLHRVVCAKRESGRAMEGACKGERKVTGSGFRVQGSGFRVQGSGFRVQGSGLGGCVDGSGFRV